jgi:hypothetical protein
MGALFFLYVFLWLFVLGAALLRSDLDPVTRLTWVLVILFVPLFGIVLYGLLAPERTTHPPGKIDPSNPLSGTPWETDPGHTNSRTFGRFRRSR